MDQRYFGNHVGLAKPKAGLYAKDNKASGISEKTVQISDLKSKWGIDLPTEEEKHLNDKWGPLRR